MLRSVLAVGVCFFVLWTPRDAHPQVIEPFLGPGPGSGVATSATIARGQTFLPLFESGLFPTLTHFSFWGGSLDASLNAEYVAYLSRWSSPTDSQLPEVLWSSGPRSVGPASFGAGVEQQFLVNLQLAPTEYIFFVRQFNDGPRLHIDASSANPYTNGHAVAQTGISPATSPEETFIGGTNTHVSGADWRFSAEFGPTVVVPEPSTYLLLGTGVAGLAVLAWRRRRRIGEPAG